MLQRLAPRKFTLTPPSAAVWTPAMPILLAPFAALAFAFGLWALGAEIAVAAHFPIATGALADWRVWFLIAAVLEGISVRFRSQSADR